MQKLLIVLLISILIGASSWIYINNSDTGPVPSPARLIKTPSNTPPPTNTPTPSPPVSHEIPRKIHVFQTFNNCGPASLSMLLSYYDLTVSQGELGDKLRPYQNPQGDNDDKSVTVAELAAESTYYNLLPYYRPNGSIELLKKLTSQNVPVLVRTWLHPDEDIGHYRIVRGYDDRTGEIIQDDSYEGKDLRYSYEVFESLWQPFNYEYLALATEDTKNHVEALLGPDSDRKAAWTHAYDRARQESDADPANPYPIMNLSVALYNLERYEEAVALYESVQDRLPARMLWYQIEPIKSYLAVGNHDQVFAMTDRILNNHNRGFSELYILRGRAYQLMGNSQAARAEFEKAVFYNIHSSEAKQALAEVSL